MKWISTKQIEAWSEDLASKANLPLLVSRLIRVTAPADSFLEFPNGAETYSGGWDGIVNCANGTGFVPKSASHWDMGTGKGVKDKADEDYEKQFLSLKPLLLFSKIKATNSS